jgi:hypothetical protein
MFGGSAIWAEHSKPLLTGDLNNVPALLEKISAGSTRVARYRRIAAAVEVQLAQFELDGAKPIASSNSGSFHWHRITSKSRTQVARSQPVRIHRKNIKKWVARNILFFISLFFYLLLYL